MIFRNTGTCFVIEPSYESPQKVSPMKNGRIGIMILETIASTIFWNSSRIFEINSAFVQAAASPIIIENTSALITGIICGIDNSKTAAGSSFNPSAVEDIDKCGIKRYPDAVEKNAAPTDDVYAIVTAIRRSFDAFLPI